MEVTYGAALHLIMANTLFPHSTEGQGYGEAAHTVLDEMIYNGNKLATARKTELMHLEGLFRELAIRIEQFGLKELFLTTPVTTDDDTRSMPSHPGHFEQPAEGRQALDIQGVHDYPSPAGLGPGVELLDDIGISSYEFLSIIEQLGGNDGSVLDCRSFC